MCNARRPEDVGNGGFHSSVCFGVNANPLYEKLNDLPFLSQIVCPVNFRQPVLELMQQ